MATTYITVRATPDALVKVYQEAPTEEVIFIDNTDEHGETAPIALPTDGGKYYVDVTLY